MKLVHVLMCEDDPALCRSGCVLLYRLAKTGNMELKSRLVEFRSAMTVVVRDRPYSYSWESCHCHLAAFIVSFAQFGPSVDVSAFGEVLKCRSQRSEAFDKFYGEALSLFAK